MNPFTRSSILKSLRAISSGTYDDSSVKSLLVDIRDYTKKNSIIREFGDFIAHPTGRNRGIVHARYNISYQGLKQFMEWKNGKTKGRVRFEIAPCFTADEVFSDLIDSIVACGLQDEADVPILTVEKENIIACMLSLIQGARFKIGEQWVAGFICFIPYGPNHGYSGTVAFCGSLPAELLGGDQYINFVFPLITTNLDVDCFLGIPFTDRQSETQIYQLQKDCDNRFRFYPHISPIGE